MQRICEQDDYFMSRCLSLARKGLGFVSPNPFVGCVIVKNGKVIAEGHHKKFGGDHAEIVALKKINFKAKGAVLYCNLEPCFHRGKTPPCVRSIIQSGISRVVVAMKDPNPLVAGRSLRVLRKSGIKVTVGILEEEARHLNRAFLTWIAKKRPYVILKMAMSLDGKITPAGKKTGWITGLEARKRVHEIRRTVDAILTGVNTVIHDDPLLNVRGFAKVRQPLRVILDSRLRTPVSAKIFHSEGGGVVLATCSRDAKKIGEYSRLGATVLVFPGKKVPLKNLLKELAGLNVASVMVEGGASLFESFFRRKLFDESRLFFSPRFLEGKAPSLFGRIPPKKLFSALRFCWCYLWGPDLEMVYSSSPKL